MITRESNFIKRSSKCNTSPTTTSRSAGLAVSTSPTLRVGAEVEIEVDAEIEIEVEAEIEIEVEAEIEVETRVDNMSLSTEAAAGMTDGIMKLKSLTFQIVISCHKTSW